jgi:hypothetical protein
MREGYAEALNWWSQVIKLKTVSSAAIQMKNYGASASFTPNRVDSLGLNLLPRACFLKNKLMNR